MSERTLDALEPIDELGPNERIDNVTVPTNVCTLCSNEGWVLAGFDDRARSPHFSKNPSGPPGRYELVGPCPACMIGHNREFGVGRRLIHGTKGAPDRFVDYTNPYPPWGRDGFWRGRDWRPIAQPVSAVV